MALIVTHVTDESIFLNILIAISGSFERSNSPRGFEFSREFELRGYACICIRIRVCSLFFLAGTLFRIRIC